MENPNTQLELVGELIRGTYGETAALMGFSIIIIVVLGKNLVVFEKLIDFFKWVFGGIAKLFLRRKEIKEQKEKENQNVVLNIDKCFNNLDVRIAEIRNVRTDDLVKDLLLVDVTECVCSAVKEVIRGFVSEYSKDKDIKTLIGNLKICINDIINRYHKKWKEKDIPNILIRKFSSIFEIEENVFIESFDLFANQDDNPNRIELDIELICSHYSSVMFLFETQIKQMNGDLNGAEYSNKIIGMYNSLGDIKISRFPFPLGVKESDIKEIVSDAIEHIHADYVSVIDVYETPISDEQIIDKLLKSKFGVSYTTNPEIFPYVKYIDRKVCDAIDNVHLSRLINNEVLFINRTDLYEWAFIRKFMSLSNLNTIIIQPILTNKDSLVGAIIYMYKEEVKDDQKGFIVNYMHTISPRCVRFLRHNI